MKNEGMSVFEDKTTDRVFLFIRGRVDSVNAPVLQSKLNDAIKSKVNKIVLNMSKVEFISSAGIRVILLMYKTFARAGGTFGIEEPSEIVKNALGMAALKELLV